MSTNQRIQVGLVSLHCLLCGHQTAEVQLPIPKLDRAALRAALAETSPDTQPRWDAALRPMCPRCHGRLILDIQPMRAWVNDLPPKGVREREAELVS